MSGSRDAGSSPAHSTVSWVVTALWIHLKGGSVAEYRSPKITETLVDNRRHNANVND